MNDVIDTIGGIMDLYGKLHKTAYSAGSSTGPIHITIILDDVFLLELAAYGDADHVLDFLHYCRTLTMKQVKLCKVWKHFVIIEFILVQM